MKRILAICLCLIFIISCGALLCGCSKEKKDEYTTPFGDEYYNTIGAGRVSFFFEFIDQSEFSQKFQINTDATYVLEALRENNMVLSKYGEATTAIAGVVADDSNGSVWVMYDEDKKVEGSYEEIKITPDRKYTFIAERK